MMRLAVLQSVHQLYVVLMREYYQILALIAQQDLREKPAMMLLPLTHHVLQLYVE